MIIKMMLNTERTKTQWKWLSQKAQNLAIWKLLSQSDKDEFIRLTDAIHEWEAAYHPTAR